MENRHERNVQQLITNVMYDQRLLINVNRSLPLSPNVVNTNSVCLFQILIFNFYLSKNWFNLKLLIKMISIKDLAGHMTHCTLHEKLTLREISTSKIPLKKKNSWTRNHLWRHASSWQCASGSGFYVEKVPS